MLWRISGPKEHEVTEGLTKLHNEQLSSLHSLTDIIKVIKKGDMGKESITHGK